MSLWHKAKFLFYIFFQAIFLPSPEDLNKMVSCLVFVLSVHIDSCMLSAFILIVYLDIAFLFRGALLSVGNCKLDFFSLIDFKGPMSALLRNVLCFNHVLLDYSLFIYILI